MPPIYFGASDSLLSRLSASSFEQSSLTSTQSFVDQSVSTFVQQTTQWQPVLAMMTGSLFYRFGRLATLGLGGSHSIPISLASHGAGLVFEASSFEFAHRGLAHLSGSSPSHGWNLSGRGGILEGIRNNLVNFGTLRLSASFTASQNVFLRNLVGDVAMVSGEEISHQLGFQSRPEGDLFQRFLHAQVIQTQLHLGNTLAFSFAPSLHAFERGLELSQPSPFENFSRPQARPLLEFPALQMAMLGPKSGGALEVEKSYMASMNSEGGNGSSSSSQAPLRTESRREANSSSSLFDAAKKVLSDMRESELSPREWEIHYTGVYPGEGKVPGFLDNFDAWFRLSSNHIPEGHRIAFVLEPLGKKMVFSSERVNDETRVNRSIVDLNMSASPSILEGTTAATGSQPPSPSPTPPPPPTQRKPFVRRESSPGFAAVKPELHAAAQAAPKAPTTEGQSATKDAVRLGLRVISNSIHLVSDPIEFLGEAQTGSFDLVYVGEPRLTEDDSNRFESQPLFFNRLSEKQTFRLHVPRTQEAYEWTKLGGRLIRQSLEWQKAPLMRASSVHDLSSLIQTLAHVLPPHSAPHSNLELTYLGPDGTVQLFEPIRQMLAAHPLALGQSVSIQVGRQGPSLRFWGEESSMVCELKEGEQALQREMVDLATSPVEQLYALLFQATANPLSQTISREEVRRLNELPLTALLPTQTDLAKRLLSQMEAGIARSDLRGKFQLLQRTLQSPDEMAVAYIGTFRNMMSYIAPLETLLEFYPNESLTELLSPSRHYENDEHSLDRNYGVDGIVRLAQFSTTFSNAENARFLKVLWDATIHQGGLGIRTLYREFYEQHLPHLPEEPRSQIPIERVPAPGKIEALIEGIEL